MGETFPITVQSVHKSPNGRLRIKLKETHVKPEYLTLEGEKYMVHKNLGRGRLVVRRENEGR